MVLEKFSPHDTDRVSGPDIPGLTGTGQEKF